MGISGQPAHWMCFRAGILYACRIMGKTLHSIRCMAEDIDILTSPQAALGGGLEIGPCTF